MEDLWISIPPVVRLVLVGVGGIAILWLAFLTLSRLLSGPIRSWTFLARYHHDGGAAGYWKAVPLLLDVLRSRRHGGSLFETTLIRTEIDILLPQIERPKLYDQPLEVREKELKAWKSKSDARDDVRQDVLGKIASWKAEEKRTGNLSPNQAMSIRGLDRGKLPFVRFKNPAELDTRRDEITRYFVVCRSMDLSDLQFRSWVQLDDGFLAPIFLVSGLMTRFKDDWGPVIDNYRKQLGGTLQTSRELVELQSFEFNCWLLWGPSIPVCSCEEWGCEAGREDKRRDGLFYQYGFGDENNSVDVLVSNGRSLDFQRDMTAWLQQPPDSSEQAVSKSSFRGAAPMSLYGKICYGPDIHSTNICNAQSAIADKEEGRLYVALMGEPVPKDAPRSNTADVTAARDAGSQYYSAYIWLMLIVCDKNGQPFHEGARNRWRNLLPVFEHGNIADASTMQTLKESLVAKTVSALKEILRRDSDRKLGIRIRYACAFDDSNCTQGNVLFPHEPIGAFSIEQYNPGTSARPTSILSILKVQTKWDKDLRDAVAEGRLLLPSMGPSRDGAERFDLRQDYSSCHLPGVIEDFFNAIEPTERA